MNINSINPATSTPAPTPDEPGAASAKNHTWLACHAYWRTVVSLEHGLCHTAREHRIDPGTRRSLIRCMLGAVDETRREQLVTQIVDLGERWYQLKATGAESDTELVHRELSLAVSTAACTAVRATAAVVAAFKTATS